MPELEPKNLRLSSAEMRVYYLRHAICPNRGTFCEKHGISPHTLCSWETGKKKLTEKGAYKLVEAFAKEGMLCNVEWLLYGTGLPPKTLEDFAESINVQQNQDETENFSSEIALFLANNPKSKIFKILDDSMEPALFQEDVVGTIPEEKNNIKSLLGKPCVVIEDENYHIRLLISSKDKDAYNLTSLNPRTKNVAPVIFNVHPKEIYKIVWIRRKN